MNKKTKILTFLLLIISFCFCSVFGANVFNTQKVSAASNSVPEVNATTYEDIYEMDTSLYNVLKVLSKALNNGAPTPGFDTDLFSQGYKDAVVTDSPDGQKLVEDLNNGLLDLTVGTKARYTCLINYDTDPIKDISGLNSLALGNIKTLVLNNNKISTIDRTDLSSLTAMVTLKAENCGLTSVEINPDLNAIHELCLSSNKLNKIDLQRLNLLGYTRPKVDLSNNEFTSIEDIEVPTSKLSKLDLAFNDLENLDFAKLNTDYMYNGAKADVLLQGVKGLDNLVAGQEIIIYQSDKIDDLNVVISYAENSSFYVDGEDNIICSTEGVEEIEKIKVPAGKILIEFYSGDTLINATNFPSLDENTINKLAAKTCSVALPAPTYNAYVNDKKVESLSQSETIKVVFDFDNISSLPNYSDIVSSANKAEIYSKNSKDDQAFSKNTSIVFDTNGEFTCSAYIMFDGLKSSTTSLDIVRQDFKSITIGIVLIVIVIVVVGAVYFITKWIRDGATIAPLTDKEIYNMKRRQERKMGYSREDYISNLDKPRHEERVTNKGYSDENMLEDLNEEPKDYSVSTDDNDEPIVIDTNIDDIK
ncbi:MAG: leucine-rich repeat domain-containing protein [Clostridia bacterium]|nr:leucine-rich repeat domain-containing protein [Clostridia bacterium]